MPPRAPNTPARKSSGYWKNLNHQKEALEGLAVELKLSSLEDWYRVTQPQVSRKIPSLLKRYNNSLSQALQAVFPEHAWDESRFMKKPNGFLRDQSNQRALLEAAGEKLGFTTLDAWYGVTKQQVKEAGLVSLLNNAYNGSLFAALRANFPDHTWLEWRFRMTPRGFWKAKVNRRRFFDWAGTQFGIDSLRSSEPKNMSKWYEVNRKEVFGMGAASVVVEYYNDSLPQALLDLYPEHSWDITKFRRAQTSIFKSDGSDGDAQKSALRAKELLESLAKTLNVSQLEEWYRISASQRLRNRKGSQMTISSRSIAKLLQLAYPDHPWDLTKFSQRKKRSEQRALKGALSSMFPNEKVIEEYSDASLKFANSAGRFTLDLYIPGLKLGFEYQGKHHIEDVSVVGAAQSQRDRDAEKVAVCQSAGIKLIHVPHTWDGSVESLNAIIGKG
jgi:hypothetical protein